MTFGKYLAKYTKCHDKCMANAYKGLIDPVTCIASGQRSDHPGLRRRRADDVCGPHRP